MHYLTNLFFNNGWIKIIAVTLVLYFAVYKEGGNNSSSGTLEKENIAENYKVAKKQTEKIFRAMSYVRKSSKKSPEGKDVIISTEERVSSIDKIHHNITKVTLKGQEGLKAKCGSTVHYRFNISARHNGKVVYQSGNTFVNIGDNSNILFERKLLGTSAGNDIVVKIDDDSNFLPPIVRKYFIIEGVLDINISVIKIVNDIKNRDYNQKVCS